MGLEKSCISAVAFLIVTISCSWFSCVAEDNVPAAQNELIASRFIQYPESIVSSNRVFTLGFFSFGSSWYLGICYREGLNPVWVANRNRPVSDASRILAISRDGNLVVLNRQKEIVWSSNVNLDDQVQRNTSAMLRDDGNLLLLDKTRKNNIIWQSFDVPGDSLIANMTLTYSARTGKSTHLTSWAVDYDPSIGRFTAGLEALYLPEIVVRHDGRLHWRSGPWDGEKFIGIPDMPGVYLDGFNITNDADGIFYLHLSYAINDLDFMFLVLYNGQFEGWYRSNKYVDYETDWRSVKTDCDVYSTCGMNAFCDSNNPNNTTICSCLNGFKPKDANEWSKGNWTHGCVRRTTLLCEMMRNSSKYDLFLKLNNMKVPAFARKLVTDEQNCKKLCLNNCSCIAYAFVRIGCMFWSENLTDMQQLPYGKGVDIYIRLDYSESVVFSTTYNNTTDGKNLKFTKVAVPIIVAVAIVFLISMAIFICWRRTLKRKGTRKDRETVLSDKNVALQELPLFTLQKLIIATDNFDVSRRLGQGGFGPVYSGKLQDGQEIAVKRLSRASCQGVEEFMNEVEVISKLQHRNLVRLLGCCVEGQEMMLVYEYMPNRSLDYYLFDAKRHELLDWKNRFNIIQGICRGLLYLHRDSRLRIIHRDLKVGNILLDEDLNPRISDFGMAKIFGGNEDQADTRRVVGTYGYMSPEYAMEGHFSEKSDIFSFGVLLLELVSGRRNTSFYGDEQALSLLEFAWKLWNEDNFVPLIDPPISDLRFHTEVFRCIHIGMLCVQELARDRPSMPAVISMLNSEIVDLPTPKKPGFIERQIINDSIASSSQQNQFSCTVNSVTITSVHGR